MKAWSLENLFVCCMVDFCGGRQRAASWET